MNEIRAAAIAADPRRANFNLSYLGCWTSRDEIEAAIDLALREALDPAQANEPTPSAGERDDALSLADCPAVLLSPTATGLSSMPWRYMPDYAGVPENASAGI